ncbi:MAG: ABC transporter substrate-binding protein, partial [Bosea sp. (in: a-proteobacteria)]
MAGSWRSDKARFQASRREFLSLAGGLVVASQGTLASAQPAKEPPSLKARVMSGTLPPMAERVPRNPRVIPLSQMGRQTGRHGGELKLLMADQRDLRMMTIYGYSRLVVFDEKLTLQPDILESYTVEDGRVFTLTLREGHRWSDGHPLTTADFIYWWQDVA